MSSDDGHEDRMSDPVFADNHNFHADALSNMLNKPDPDEADEGLKQVARFAAEAKGLVHFKEYVHQDFTFQQRGFLLAAKDNDLFKLTGECCAMAMCACSVPNSPPPAMRATSAGSLVQRRRETARPHEDEPGVDASSLRGAFQLPRVNKAPH